MRIVATVASSAVDVAVRVDDHDTGRPGGRLVRGQDRLDAPLAKAALHLIHPCRLSRPRRDPLPPARRRQSPDA